MLKTIKLSRLSITSFARLQQKDFELYSSPWKSLMKMRCTLSNVNSKAFKTLLTESRSVQKSYIHNSRQTWRFSERLLLKIVCKKTSLMSLMIFMRLVLKCGCSLETNSTPQKTLHALVNSSNLTLKCIESKIKHRLQSSALKASSERMNY